VSPARLCLAHGLTADRSTGFEKKLFQYQNAAVRRELEHNQWSMEDM